MVSLCVGTHKSSRKYPYYIRMAPSYASLPAKSEMLDKESVDHLRRYYFTIGSEDRLHPGGNATQCNAAGLVLQELSHRRLYP